MVHPDAKRWNARYANEGEKWQTRSPRPLLLEYVHLLPLTGLALDAAAGVALHGLFLAERGLHVIALDISEVGLGLALRSAKERGVWLETAVYDLSRPWLPADTFDVIVNFRFLERAAFPVYRHALKPGGLLFFETFLKIGTEPDYPDHYLNPGELRDAFAEWEIVHSAVVKGGCRSGRQVVAEQLVAYKP
ncbi:MAG: class I SAM-dependent methyltransferase [Chloroflexi bacterium]|nr:class I SAM-dependent methyltransferase [Chloroflexota bacterium]